MIKEKLWSRDYILAMVVNLSTASVFYMLLTTAAVYAFERFAASEAMAGVVSGSWVVGAVVARIFTGKYLDLIGRKKVLVVTLAVGVVISIAYLFLPDLLSVIVVRALHGLAFGAASTAVTAGALSLIPASRRGEGTGYFGVSSTTANAIGPVVGLALIAVYGYDWMFLAAAMFCALGLAVALVLRIPSQEPTEYERQQARRMTVSTLIDTATLPIASLVFVTSLGFAGIVGFLNAYSIAEGAAAAGAAFFAVFGLTVVASRLLVGRLQDRFGDNAVIPALIVIYAAGLVVLSISPTGVSQVISAVLVGIGFGALFPCLQAVAIGISPQRIGLATSTFYLMADGSIAIGPMIFGALLPLLGFRGVYLLFAAFTLCSLVLYYFVHGRNPARTTTSPITPAL